MQYLNKCLLTLRSQLFKGCITLSTGYIVIEWISVTKTNHAIHCIAIYPVDSVIHLLNNLGQVYSYHYYEQGG